MEKSEEIITNLEWSSLQKRMCSSVGAINCSNHTHKQKDDILTTLIKEAKLLR